MKHYNLDALRGGDTTDEEVCQELGLDPKLAGTPKINAAAVSKMQQENYNEYIRRGMDAGAARARADSQAELARSRIKEAMN
jgi:hypothetical protein